MSADEQPTPPPPSTYRTWGYAPCHDTPGDGVTIVQNGTAVAVMIDDDDQTSCVVLCIAHARGLAAALLNAADAIDGTKPLLWLGGPSSEEPTRD